jgi:hypothetical protein
VLLHLHQHRTEFSAGAKRQLNHATIEWTPLKPNTLTITAIKFDGDAASNAIALSVRKKSEMKKKKIMKEKEDKDAADYKEKLELQCKNTKINQMIPHVVDGYCNSRKIPDKMEQG